MKLSVVMTGLVLATSGCEKSGDVGGKSSGAATSDEAALLQYLPGNSTALFGGDYMKLQKNITDSALGKLAATMEKTAPGMSAWMDCWVALPDVKMLGAVTLDMTGGKGMRMQFVMTGATVSDLDACARKANFTSTIDPDKKFVSIEMTSALGPMKTGYLVLPTNAIYLRMAMPLGGKPEPSDRALLENDIAALKGNTMDKDTKLLAAMKKVDRSRPVWFVADLSRTPAAGKVGLVMATVDMTSGLTMDVAAELVDKALADQVVQGFDQAKKSADQLPNGMGDIVKNIDLSRSGETVRAKIAINKQQFATIMEQFGKQLGALGSMAH